MTRYYITRNRGYIARYFQVHGDYNPVLFGVGTALTFAKRLFGLILADRAHFSSGLSRLIKVGKMHVLSIKMQSLASATST